MSDVVNGSRWEPAGLRKTRPFIFRSFRLSHPKQKGIQERNWGKKAFRMAFTSFQVITLFSDIFADKVAGCILIASAICPPVTPFRIISAFKFFNKKITTFALTEYRQQFNYSRNFVNVKCVTQ